MARQGVLLINLGSPDGANEHDVREYLRECLMDGRVIDLRPIARWLLVNWRIIPRRTEELTHAYEAIWSPKGSPLIVAGRSMAEKLEKALGMPVALAMRYGRPTVSLALRRLYSAGVRELTVLPLFPQYATSGYETAARHVEAEIQTMVPGMTHRFVPPIFEEPEYLEAVSATASPMLAHGFDHVLFSFQGVPERQLRTSDPTGSHCMGSEHCCELFSPARRTCYRAQCLATARGVAERLEIPEGQWSVSFQSGLGREPWTRPNTETTLKSLGGRGVERLFVLCPSFVADCPETLEEIGIRGKETYHSAGGGELTLVPCLNDHPAWIEAICSILVRQIDPAECAYPN